MVTVEIVFLFLYILAVVFVVLGAFGVSLGRASLAWIGVACYFAVAMLQALMGL